MALTVPWFRNAEPMPVLPRIVDKTRGIEHLFPIIAIDDDVLMAKLMLALAIHSWLV